MASITARFEDSFSLSEPLFIAAAALDITVAKRVLRKQANECKLACKTQVNPKFKLIFLSLEALKVHNESTKSIERSVPGVSNSGQMSTLDTFSWANNLNESSSSTESVAPVHEQFFEKEWNLFINELKLTKETNPIKFWIENAKTMPILSETALSIFTVPASTAAVERYFSLVTLNTASRKANSKLDLINQNVFMSFNRAFINI